MILSDSVVQDLRDLFAEIGVDGSLEDCLEELATSVGRILRVEGCTIVLLKDDEAQIEASSARTGLGPSYCAAPIPKKTSPTTEQGANPLPSQLAGAEFGCMFSKIVLNGKIIGVVQAELPIQQRPFDKNDLDLFSVLMPIITKSIQVIRLQHLLRSRFSQVALVKSGDVPVSEILTLVMQNPNQTARILARSFYREMLNAGFSFNQIIFAATEVISELTSSVRKHGRRQKRARGDREDYSGEHWSSTESAIRLAGPDSARTLAAHLSS